MKAIPTYANRTFSFDAETNGLYGQAFCISAVLFDENGDAEATFCGRCPIEGSVNPWVESNVLPQMEDIPETCGSYRELLGEFIAFFAEHSKNSDVIVHMGVPVEAKLFIDAVQMGIMGEFDGPYPLIDISALPEINVSVDTYLKEKDVECDEQTHNPLYDCWAAAFAYRHCMNKQ